MLTAYEILNLFEQKEGILKGHFILSSGLHSDTYIQCAKLASYPDICEQLCKTLAIQIKNKFPNVKIDKVVSPAMGGVIVGYETARALKVPAIFCERVDGKFTLRRGFELKKGDNVLVVEDVVTTGKSSLETIECIESYGANVIGEASWIDRQGDNNKFNIPLVSLLKIAVNTYSKDNLPEELKKIEAIKPGSRFLKN